ncbi:TPA: GA-like domain-containing protein [Escherichia coli]
MKMIFTGKVSGEKTVLTAGARHTVKAQAGEQYGLVDEVTGLVPDGVEADRSGDDLILRKKEDDTEIRIEGFWEECQPGETQCTAVFNVVGENGQVTEAVLTQDGPVLENFTAGQSGTLAEGINNGIIWGGIAFGAGLAAIALAAGGGGGSSRHKRATEGEQKPVQPEGGQEAGKTEVSSTASTEAGSGSSSDQVPAVDENGNGKPDAEEAAEAVNAATAKVAEAEAKEKEAEAALTQAKADNKITQQEHDDLAAKNDAVTAAKADAAKAVEGLPAGDAKDGLNGRLAKVDGIDVPAVDENGNGKPDAIDRIGTVIYTGNVNMTQGHGVTAGSGQKVKIADDDLQKDSKSFLAIKAHEANVGTNVYVISKNGANNVALLEMTEGDNIITTELSLGNLGVSRWVRPMVVDTGAGDDTIVTGRDLGIGYSDLWTEVNTGIGDDILIVGFGRGGYDVVYGKDGSYRIEETAKYQRLDGDIIIPDNDSGYPNNGGFIEKTTVTMEDGNDSLLLLGGNSLAALKSSTLDLGAGNDVIDIVANIDNASNIKGGSGFDTLVIHQGNATSNTFSGFEKIELKDGAALNLLAENLNSASIEGNKLKVTGDGSSRVDLGNNGDNLSDNGYNWIKGSTESEGDITYNIYTHASVPDVQVLIDERITNVV